ncbi:hypothetical protein J1N35_004955 [Gossypium stocksii]|uniref:Glutamine amidotransferase domain-containing protein n=1 Tax=Gossypium stocksii TaxID=47602 RepID=A0A9D3WEE6_9ROSI|nr:hypothetical protein J1N35_004955 [Gossypium stocksii]
MVNSNYHQGVKKLPHHFMPMAFAPDGLVESFYDPKSYNPDEGKFLMGLQFHPERMHKPDSNVFIIPDVHLSIKEDILAAYILIKFLMRVLNERKI